MYINTCFKWILFFWCTTVFALPQNPNVVSQEAQILVSSRQVMEIAAQDGAVIEWSDFSIEMPETVRFAQPSIDAIVLNRVVGSEMSQILGKLEANGQVLLINPNGVLFGQESQINTGSFIASTLDLQNDLFAKNKLFKGTSTAQIINLGSLNVSQGSLALIASDINSQGSLNAENGTVSLIGSTYVQDFECQFPNENGSRITHSGRIDSPGGHVHLMAGEIYVFKSSVIETSSLFSGGEILIGAGLQGKDPSFTNAQMIWVEEGAHFFADTWETGNGGQVILFSEGVTDFAGLISATGGMRGGDGGFAEVSGHYLSYRGFADLRSPLGKTGTLLLDPTDITIAGANANSSFTPGFLSFPFSCFGSNCLGSNCSGMSNISRIGTTIAGLSSTINVATIAAQVSLSHVVIDSTGGVGGSGNITWMPGFDLTPPLFPVTANDLVLRAPLTSTVSILSNVQNPGTGRVVIDSLGSLVEINRIGNPQRVSFGADDGLTEICAPNATVNVQGTAGGIAQVGFYTLLGGTSLGPIRICCRNLNVLASAASNFGGAQVGHGRIDSTTGMFVAATIDVVASQNITIISGPPGTIRSHAKIGHGVDAPIGGFGDYRGNINVQAGGGDLVTPGLRMLGSGQSGAMIGNGIGFSGPFTNLGGNIQVQVPNGSILMESNSPGGGLSPCIIGHGHTQGSAVTTLSGDVFVCCRGNLTLSDLDAGLSGVIGIGHFEAGVIATYMGNILITVGGNITLNAAPPLGPSFAGEFFLGLRNGSASLIHTTQIICGGNFSATLNNKALFIGAPNGVATSNANTLIATAGNFTIDAQGGAALVFASADLAIAAGGDFTVTSMGGPPFGGGNFVTSLNVFVAGRPNDTRIYAGGNIIGLNSPSVFTVLGNASSAGNPNYNVDFRAGGDIQLPNNLNNAQTGNIFLEADTLLPAGALWMYTGGVITSICGLPAIPVLCTPACPSPLAGRATGVNSPALTPNGVGCFSAVKAPSATLFLPAILSTTTGDITLHSAPTRGAGTCNLDIGNEVRLTTTSGNIEVYGSALTPCIRTSFYDVVINQAIVTTGTVRIVANHDLTISSTGSINSGNSPVELVCDNQFPIPFLLDSGQFVMDFGSSITTGTAPLHIYTVQPNLNTINGTLNGQTFPPPGGAANFFTDTCFEQWCAYYCANIPLSCATPPNPTFTIAYKLCLPLIINPPFGPSPPAIVGQFLVSLHPYNEFPGWMMRYTIDYKKKVREYSVLKQSPYMLRRRLLNSINHPKSWTQLIEDTH